MKKRSDASSTPKSHNPPIFFIDACLGKQIAQILREAGELVEHHNVHFPDGTRDEIWLAESGKRGWIVLTKDDQIRYHHVAKFAIKDSGAAAIILSRGNLKSAEMAAIFLKAIPKIKRFIKNHEPPFLLRLTPGGDLSQVKL